MGLANWPGTPPSSRVNPSAGVPAGRVHSRPEVPPRYRFQYAGSREVPLSSATPAVSTATSVIGPNGSTAAVATPPGSPAPFDGPDAAVGSTCAQVLDRNG